MRISSTEFQREFSRYQDEALREPVVLTRNGRERLVLLAIEEYRRLKRRDRQVMLAGELSDDDLAAIERARMPTGREHLDDELD